MGHDGTLIEFNADGAITSGTWSTDVPTVFGTGFSLSFNGSSTWVRLAAALDAFPLLTLAGWFKITSAATFQVLFGNDDGNFDRGLNVGFTAGNYGVHGNSDSKNTGIAAVTGTWVHLAVVYEASNARLYENGTLVWSHGSALSTYDGSHYGALGRSNFGSGSAYYDGLAKDVRVYGRALSSGDVATLASGSEPSATDLLIHFPLSEGGGSVAYSLVQPWKWVTDRPSIFPSGYSLRFSGDASRVETPDHTELDFGPATSFSVTCWMKCTGRHDDYTGLVVKANALTDWTGWQLVLMATGQVALFAGSPVTLHELNPTVTSSSSSVNNGAWRHIGLVVDKSAGTVEMYVDGTRETLLTTATADVQVDHGSSGNLLAGTDRTHALNYCGYLDDVKVWRRALSGPEILVLYTG